METTLINQDNVVRKEQSSNVTPPLTDAERARILKQLKRLAITFDEAVRIPGTGITLGWDAVIGMIPFVGDGFTTGVSTYFLWQANKLGASDWTLIRIVLNTIVDFAIGTIPVVGDLFDVTWRANRKNYKLILKELEKHGYVPDDEEKLP